MLLSKANLMVSNVASTNPSDIGINCVHINPDGSTVAANGKVVMAVGPVDEGRITFPDVGERAIPGPRGTSIPLDLLDKAVKNLPREKKASLQCVAMTKGRDPKKVQLTTTDMRHEQRIEGFPKPEPFPEWKAALRKIRGDGVSGARICLNRRDLIELLKAMDEACPDHGSESPIFMEINEQGTGLIVRATNRETNQRAIGGITAYNTNGQWVQADAWEKEVFGIAARRLIKG